MRVNTILNELKNSVTTLFQLTRALSYTRFLFMLVPFFSLLASDNIVSSPVLVISLIIPFVFLHAAGFTYNFMCDVHVDSVDKNPITKGSISKNKASLLLLAFLLISAILFTFFYRSVAAFLLFAVYMFFWLSYSGLKIRFKESLIGVFVASFVLWVAAPLILITEFSYFSNTVVAILLFVFLTYAGQEMLHTILDYDNDSAKNCKTFAVQAGRKKAIIIMCMLILVGYLCILWNSVSSGDFVLQVLSFLYGVGYVTIVAIQILSYRLQHSLQFLWVSGRWPFLLARLYLLILSLIFLELSPFMSFLIVLAFLTYQYRTGKFT
jgi:4-hydroxybenzoate polyprenyltransferase